MTIQSGGADGSGLGKIKLRPSVHGDPLMMKGKAAA
jgi:hypothetical protein